MSEELALKWLRIILCRLLNIHGPRDVVSGKCLYCGQADGQRPNLATGLFRSAKAKKQK